EGADPRGSEGHTLLPDLDLVRHANDHVPSPRPARRSGADGEQAPQLRPPRPRTGVAGARQVREMTCARDGTVVALSSLRVGGPRLDPHTQEEGKQMRALVPFMGMSNLNQELE